MVSVEFNLKKKGACQWCRKEKDEIYDVTFGDKTFVGMLCKADLFRAIDMKLPEVKAEAKGATSTSHTVTHSTGSGTSVNGSSVGHSTGHSIGESKQTNVSGTPAPK